MLIRTQENSAPVWLTVPTETSRGIMLWWRHRNAEAPWTDVTQRFAVVFAV